MDNLTQQTSTCMVHEESPHDSGQGQETKESFQKRVQIGRKRADRTGDKALRPHLSFSGADKELFLRLVDGANYTSQSHYCMDMALRRPTPEMKTILRTLRKPAKSLSDNLNQIAAQYNTYGWNKHLEKRLKAQMRQLQVFIEGAQCFGMIGYYMADMHERVCYEPFFENSRSAEQTRQKIADLILRTGRTLNVLEQLLNNIIITTNEQQQ